MQRLAEAERIIVANLIFVMLVMLTYKLLVWGFSRMPGLRHKWGLWNSRISQRAVSGMSESLLHFNLDSSPNESLRTAGRATAGEIRLRYGLLTFAIGMGMGDLVGAGIHTIETGQLAQDLRPRTLLSAAVIMPILIWGANRNQTISRYRFLLALMRTVGLCMAAATSSSDDRPGVIQSLDHACANVRRSILRVHRIDGSVKLFSHRRHAIKANSALVVARLQQVENEIGAHGDAALKELARLLLEIANNCAEGDIRNLLPQSELQGITASTSRAAALRLAAVVLTVATVACTWLILDLPGEAMPVAAGCAGLLTAIAAYGPSAAVSRLAEIRGILGI